jgi:predicted transposase/invertase (TIGR01784 family)
MAYENSLKYYRDLKNSLDTAKEDGIELGYIKGKEEGKIEGKIKGIEEGIMKVAKNFLDSNIPLDIISQNTGLTYASPQ